MANKRPLKERFKLWGLTQLVKFYFHIEKYLVKFKNINYPKEQCIFSLWHCHQFLVYAVEDKSKFYALISASNDGEIISKSAASLGVMSIRGSSKRRGVAASLELIEKIKEGNYAAIMIDGPRGPVFKAKDGIINIAKITGVPIVPCAWYSPEKTFISFNTWDKFKAPFGPCKTIALYGEPIHIPSELTKEEIKEWCEKIEEKMMSLQKDLEENYDKYLNS
ncbi:lysophospholipid acyltransferase family protein [bacterium]|nr:lysophospholipid acyltransferase family protein [bacterium]